MFTNLALRCSQTLVSPISQAISQAFRCLSLSFPTQLVLCRSCCTHFTWRKWPHMALESRAAGALRGCFCLSPSINIEAVFNLESDSNASTVGWLAAYNYNSQIRYVFRWVSGGYNSYLNNISGKQSASEYEAFCKRTNLLQEVSICDRVYMVRTCNQTLLVVQKN